MFQTRVPLSKLDQMPETFDLSNAPVPNGYRLVRAGGIGYQIVMNVPGSDDPAPGSVELSGDDILYTIYPHATGAMTLFDDLVRYWKGRGLRIYFDDVKS